MGKTEAWTALREMFLTIAGKEEIVVFRQLMERNMIKECTTFMLKVTKEKIK